MDLRKGLEKALHLKTSLSVSNMFLFDSKGRLKKYASELEILTDFAEVRREVYVLRKAFLMKQMEREAAYLFEKARFIQMVSENQLLVEDRPTTELCGAMRRLGLRTQRDIEAGEEAPRKRLRAAEVDLAGPETWRQAGQRVIPRGDGI